jgi:hypothetical protein
VSVCVLLVAVGVCVGAVGVDGSCLCVGTDVDDADDVDSIIDIDAAGTDAEEDTDLCVCGCVCEDAKSGDDIGGRGLSL